MNRRQPTDNEMTSAQEPLVSIVTPFYNTANYLEDCIKSVLAQTYTNWEYVLVNNQSTDGSLEIAQKYAQRDRRIRVICQTKFLSQSDNYNTALEKISPESVYCKVVQADDIIFPTCVEQMVRLGEDKANVGVISSYYMYGSTIRNVGLPYGTSVVSGSEPCRRHLMPHREFLFGTPSTILVRSNIVRSRRPFYPTPSMMGDLEACYEILQTWDFGFVHQVLSYSRVHEESITEGILPYNPYLLDHLILLKKYGAAYLTAAELDDCWRRAKRKYLRFLAIAALHGRSRSFWEYHRSGLRRIDYRVSTLTLFPYMCFAMADALLQPKLLLTHLWAKCAGNR
jgi:glycosyltransferase involved in cell wall biosynthesis